MKAIIAVLFVVVALILSSGGSVDGKVEAAEVVQHLPQGTKIYLQGAGADNRFMIYQYSTEDCARAYGYVDTATGVEAQMPRTTFSCTFPRAPQFIQSADGLSVVQKLDEDSYYVKHMEI